MENSSLKSISHRKNEKNSLFKLHTCHFLTEAGYEVIPRVRSDSSAARDRQQARHRHGDPAHVDTGIAAERRVSC